MPLLSIKGFATTEYLASALMDLKLHMTDPDQIDMSNFEQETLKSLNMPKTIAHAPSHPTFWTCIFLVKVMQPPIMDTYGQMS